MRDRTPDNNESGVLLKVLTAHYHALVAARSNETLLKQYAELLRFLKSKRAPLLDQSVSTKPPSPSRPLPLLSDEELRKTSLSDLENLVNDEASTRKDLEWIAIQRFSVPRGSMRSFSSKQMLVDKLRTLIANERTHETIGSVARGDGGKESKP